jgi:hypothetical protein
MFLVAYSRNILSHYTTFSHGSAPQYDYLENEMVLAVYWNVLTKSGFYLWQMLWETCLYCSQTTCESIVVVLSLQHAKEKCRKSFNMIKSQPYLNMKNTVQYTNAEIYTVTVKHFNVYGLHHVYVQKVRGRSNDHYQDSSDLCCPPAPLCCEANWSPSDFWMSWNMHMINVNS